MSQAALESPRQPSPFAIYAVLILVQFVAAAGLTVLYTMLATLYREYADGQASVGWAVTAYLLVAAACGALCGRLGDLLGRRRMILIMLTIAGIGALISSLVPTLAGVIVGCALQGVAGALTPLDIGLARENLPASKVPVAVGIITAAGVSGSGVVFLFAGWVTDHFASHGAFLMKAVLAALAFAAVLAIVPAPERKAVKLDRIDMIRGSLFVPALAAILLGIDQARVWGWAEARTIGVIAAGVLTLAFWARHQLRQTAPLIDIRLLLRCQILMANIVQMLLGMGCVQAGQVLSLFWQQPAWTGAGFGLTATGAGWLFFLLFSTAMISSPWSGRIAGRYGARRAACIGAVLVLLAWAAMAASHAAFWPVMGAALGSAIGVSVIQAAAYNLIVEDCPQERTSEAAGMAYVSFTIAMAIGSQIIFKILGSSTVVDAAQGAGSYPSNLAFTWGFGYIAASCLVVLLVLLALPRRTMPDADIGFPVRTAGGA